MRILPLLLMFLVGCACTEHDAEIASLKQQVAKTEDFDVHAHRCHAEIHALRRELNSLQREYATHICPRPPAGRSEPWRL